MVTFVEGEKVADRILAEVRGRIAARQLRPKLAVFLVGENPASLTYAAAKKKRALDAGISVRVYNYPTDLSQDKLGAAVKSVIAASHYDGIIIQLPLPPQMDRRAILDLVPAEQDVDGLAKGRGLFTPPAAGAVMEILNYYKVDLAAKRVLLVGMGDLIGRPLAEILRRQGVSFETVYLGHGDLRKQTPQADVIISGTGQPALITGDLIKPGAVVIDAGTAGTDKGVVAGDVDTASVAPKAGLLSAVPGGVGPVTVAMLLRNVVEASLRRA